MYIPKSHWALIVRVRHLVLRVWYLVLCLRGFMTLGDITARVPRVQASAAMEVKVTQAALIDGNERMINMSLIFN